MKNSVFLALLGLASASEQVVQMDDIISLVSLFNQLDKSLINLIEAQKFRGSTFHEGIPSVDKYDGYHFNQWDVIPQDLPKGGYSEYVTPTFKKVFWNEQHQGLPLGYRFLYIDELLQDEHNLNSNIQSFLPAWDIVAVINGWTEGSGYGGKVVEDGGERGVGWILLVNEDYPIWIETIQGPQPQEGPEPLVTPSVTEFGGYYYHYFYVLPEAVPTNLGSADGSDYVNPTFIKKLWNDEHTIHTGVPAGYRHMFVDEILGTNSMTIMTAQAVQRFLPAWNSVALMNGWTIHDYEAKVVKDGGEEDVPWMLFVNEDFPVYF